MMQDTTIVPRCPNKQCRARLAAQHYLPGTHCLSCPRCGEGLTISLDENSLGRELAICPICQGREFFIRKDFPQRAGLLLVFLFGIVASVFYYKQNIVATFATLFLLVLVDAAIFLFVGKVSVCYRCRAEFRHVAYNSAHGGFDLATSEKYD